MKMKMTIIAVMIPFVFGLVSCSKSKSNTDHPDHAMIILETDWSKLHSSITAPDKYTVRVGEHTAELQGNKNEFPHLLEHGKSYHINVFTTSSDVSVDGTRVTVASEPGSKAGEEFIKCQPGLLITWSGDITNCQRDTKHPVKAVMTPEMRCLKIILKLENENITDHIMAVNSTLSGIAGEIHLDECTLSKSCTTRPSFQRDNTEYQANLHLLGVLGDAQTLGLELTRSDNSVQTFNIDLSDRLADFNADKITPMTIVISGQSIDGLTGTIKDWVVKEGYTGHVN